MLSTTVPSPSVVVVRGRPRWLAPLQHAWARWGWNADERFLASAVDLADLEVRLRRLERGRPDRFGPLPPTP